MKKGGGGGKMLSFEVEVVDRIWKCYFYRHKISFYLPFSQIVLNLSEQ